MSSVDRAIDTCDTSDMGNHDGSEECAIPQRVWESIECEAYHAGREAGLCGPRARPGLAAELYAMDAVERWGELLPEVTTGVMEAIVEGMRAAYRAGYATILGEAYAAGWVAGAAGMPASPALHWREASDLELELTGGPVRATVGPQLADAYMAGHYAGHGASRS